MFERSVHDRVTEPVRCNGLDDPKLPRLLPKAALAKPSEELEMAKAPLRLPFDPQADRDGYCGCREFPVDPREFDPEEKQPNA